jgi:hypothetical protein
MANVSNIEDAKSVRRLEERVRNFLEVFDIKDPEIYHILVQMQEKDWERLLNPLFHNQAEVQDELTSAEKELQEFVHRQVESCGTSPLLYELAMVEHLTRVATEVYVGPYLKDLSDKLYLTLLRDRTSNEIIEEVKKIGKDKESRTD